MSRRIQVRNWCFTLNNPGQDDEDYRTLWQQLVTDGVASYVVFQRERGEQGGTVHLQGYVQFCRSRDRNYVKRKLGSSRFHLEPAKGSPAQNKAYCTKADTRLEGHDPHELGECPHGQGQRSDLARVGKRIRDGETVGSIALAFDDDFGTVLRNRRHFEWLANQLRKKQCTPKTVIWLHGPTGTGKSRWCHENHPDAFWKPPGNKWFDGYDGEDTIIIDDYRSTWTEFGYSQLLRITDRYPCTVEVKGGSVSIGGVKTIVITSNHAPRNAFDLNPAHENIDQLLRRITEVRELLPEGSEPFGEVDFGGIWN